MKEDLSNWIRLEHLASPVLKEILWEIYKERRRQDQQWGLQRHTPGKWALILGEEVGEVFKAALQRKPAQVKEELIQVAAVAVAWLEDAMSREK